MFATVILVSHVLLGMGIIGLVLIQHGKGADAGAAFGSGASSTVFGSRGSGSFLTRTTGVFAVLFFASSMTLALMARQTVPDSSLLDQPAAEEFVIEFPLTDPTESAESEPDRKSLSPILGKITLESRVLAARSWRAF